MQLLQHWCDVVMFTVRVIRNSNLDLINNNWVKDSAIKLLKGDYYIEMPVASEKTTVEFIEVSEIADNNISKPD